MHAATAHALRRALVGATSAATARRGLATAVVVPLSHAVHEPAADSGIPRKPDPLVVLPGLFGSKQNWRGVAKSLASASGHAVVPVDLRNHGASPHVPRMGYGEMAGDVAALLPELAVSQSVLVGHSMGGRVAMSAAVAHPAKFPRLVIVDVSPVAAPNGANTFARYLDLMRQLDDMRLTRRRAAQDFLAEHVPDESIRMFLLTNLVATPDGELRFRINLPAIAAFMPTMWNYSLGEGPVYTQPALFVRGTRSGYIPDTHLPELHALFPNAEVASMEGAGHWPHAERPAEFVQIKQPTMDTKKSQLDAPVYPPGSASATTLTSAGPATLALGRPSIPCFSSLLLVFPELAVVPIAALDIWVTSDPASDAVTLALFDSRVVAAQPGAGMPATSAPNCLATIHFTSPSTSAAIPGPASPAPLVVSPDEQKAIVAGRTQANARVYGWAYETSGGALVWTPTLDAGSEDAARAKEKAAEAKKFEEELKRAEREKEEMKRDRDCWMCLAICC
ncbi:hypothetical protein H9P43_006117 [Blastocladiella emersonii ATCC 22665]|nr:hypothetical protein H9P43_006117 [Blastocladiella emersonii ATCC 22665]